MHGWKKKALFYPLAEPTLLTNQVMVVPLTTQAQARVFAQHSDLYNK
jgi:hypothetical protein